MSKERKTYRRSPGRQYDSNYDPLSSQHGASQSDRMSSQSGSRSGTLHSQRPDPRRTRQLLRQQIISSKSQGTDEENTDLQELETDEVEQRIRRTSGAMVGHTTSRHLRGNHDSAYEAPHLPTTRELYPDEGDEWEQAELDEVMDDEYGDDPLDARVDYASSSVSRPSQIPPRRSALIDERRESGSRLLHPTPAEEEYEEFEEEYEDDEYEEIDERQARRQKKRNRKMTRRGILIGLGAATVAGAGITAYELGPKLPQAIGDAGTNIERQVQDAFNKGLTQGAENARKEMLTALENLEGFTLDGAITAAKLTRVAYDVFVAPIVQFGSSVAVDFLKAMLSALKTARGLLAGVYQDNATLQAIQKVLESWVDQVQKMPKQLTAITQTDLDGAQSYLRALQRKVEEEKAKLANPQTTPTVSATSQTTPTPKTKK
ncbi:hypothetical protein [Ktedonospora formicarum]|uniref:Uncharacterized protein n=1 Tax=Ktedonospora formicarum TaxID=2778364 RepID=A0A8J3I205_9CHLR|nr:hypothetical protein [Ktedonospora formicarum]GHO44598.1 hypothetical protein KSX_27610 [Ktedonospora formicarum]